ncbi:hypothetical protein YC2023_043211 [Brassica napus]
MSQAHNLSISGSCFQPSPSSVSNLDVVSFKPRRRHLAIVATESVATVAEFEHHLPPQAAVTAKGRRVVDHDVEEEAVHVDFTAEEIRTTKTWQSSLLDITSAHGRGPRNTPSVILICCALQVVLTIPSHCTSSVTVSHELRRHYAIISAASPPSFDSQPEPSSIHNCSFSAIKLFPRQESILDLDPSEK